MAKEVVHGANIIDTSVKKSIEAASDSKDPYTAPQRSMSTLELNLPPASLIAIAIEPAIPAHALTLPPTLSPTHRV